MQDGQNLFDPAVSYAGVTWDVAAAAESLADIGRQPIVVGLYHGGRRRIREYNPFAHWRNGRGANYARFVAETVKPMIDATFRTLPEREHSALLGSSMGGLISLYTCYVYGETFGRCGAMSPSLWVAGGAILKMAPAPRPAGGRIYVDNGDQEPGAQRLALLLEQAGYTPGRTLRYVVGAGDGHTEAAWARRLPDAASAFASGWMQLRGARRRQGLDRGFVLSDHADWPGLVAAIAATGASRVIVTHGYEAVMVRWLRQQGLEAGSFRTEYGDEQSERDEAAEPGEPAADPAADPAAKAPEPAADQAS